MRQLADGHWVLAFSSGDKAALAVTLVQQHATRLQGLYGDALAPICGTLQQQEQLLQEPEESLVQQHKQQEEQQQTQGQQEQQQQQQGQTLQQLDSQQLEQRGSTTHSAAAEQQSIMQQEQQAAEQLPQQGQPPQLQLDTLSPAAPGDPGPGASVTTPAEAAAQAPGSTDVNTVWHSPQAEQQTHQRPDQFTMQDVTGQLGHVSLGDDTQQLS